MSQYGRPQGITLGTDSSTWNPNSVSAYLAASDALSDAPDQTSDPMVLAALTTIPSVREALLRIKGNQMRSVRDEKWGTAMRSILEGIRSRNVTVETNGLANQLMAGQMVSYADELHEMVGAINQLLASSTVYHLGMGTLARERFFTTLVAPLSGVSIGYTPTEGWMNTYVRKYPATVTVETKAPTDMLRVFLPSTIERNADNGAFLYVKGFEDLGALGLKLTQDETTTVIGTKEARWGHVSSAIAFRNVNASISTLGTVSATAIAPSTKVLRTLTQSSLVNYTAVVKDRNVRAVPQSRQIVVRNDSDTLFYVPRSVSTVTRSSFTLFEETLQDMRSTGKADMGVTLTKSRRLAAVQYNDPYGMAAQACSPYFSRATRDETAIAAIINLVGGSGYVETPTVTVSEPDLVGGVQYGVGAKLNIDKTKVVNGVVTSIEIIYHGHGYTTAPTITISAPPSTGTQATAQAVLVRSVSYSATGACVPNAYYPPLVCQISTTAFAPPTASPDGLKGQTLPTGYPLTHGTAPHFNGHQIMRLGSINPGIIDNAQPILGVQWRVKGQAVRVWPPAATVVRDTGMQYLYIFAVAESDNGTCYGFPHDNTCGKGQIMIPTPWTPGTDDRVPTSMPSGTPEKGNSSGVQPAGYSIINLSGGSAYKTQGDNQVPVDSVLEIDNTQGERATAGSDGNGFWSYAIGCGNGNVRGGTDANGRAALSTMNDAITDVNGWARWNRASATEYTRYKPYNIERCDLYAMVICSSINNGAAGATGAGETDWTLGGWDLSNITIEANQMRYQPESNDRIAMLIASNQGAQSFGIQTDINVLSTPLDDEIQAQPVPGYTVKTADLVEMTRSIPNAQVGEVVTRDRK